MWVSTIRMGNLLGTDYVRIVAFGAGDKLSLMRFGARRNAIEKVKATPSNNSY